MMRLPLILLLLAVPAAAQDGPADFRALRPDGSALSATGGQFSDESAAASGAGALHPIASAIRVIGPGDYGAVGNGVADDVGAFRAATTALGGPGTLWLRPGAYNMSEPIHGAHPDWATWIIPAGVSFPGRSHPEAVTDLSIINGNGTGLAIAHQSGTGSNSATLYVSHNITPSGSGVAYEKMGVYSRVMMADDSAAHDLDAVSYEAQCMFGSRIQSGRCWGYDAVVTVPRGTDGYAVGYEVGINNHSSDQPNYGTRTSKIGLHIVAGGSVPSTAAVVITRANAVAWHDGVVVNPGAIAGKAFRILNAGHPDNAFIAADGGAQFRALNVTPSAPASASSPCTPGQISTDNSYVYVCTGPNAWKRAALASW